MKDMTLPERLQGTDGVRGLVLKSESGRVRGMNPVEAYVKQGVITEEFAELYGYCLGKFLLSKKFIKDKGKIVVGWDPRDRKGIVVKPFIRGLSRAVKKIISIGVVPTPAAVVFMQYSGARAAAVLTASHNPAEQNGIKIFLAPLGMKLLPRDEAEFSRLVYRTTIEQVRNKKASGEVKDMNREALSCFREFLLSKDNSWIEPPGSLSKYFLFTDSSNGAYSGISADIFRSAGFKRVIETAGDLSKPVNEGCGVSEVEGRAEWRRNSLSGAPEVIKRIFRESEKLKLEIQKGQVRISGAVFDGDGDRFLRVDYNQFNDSVFLLNGDRIAALVCRYLGTEVKASENIPLFNTIESDVKASQYANSFGFTGIVTGVGDKWILFYSLSNFLKEVLNNSKVLNIREKEKKKISDYLNAVKGGKAMSAFSLSEVLDSIGILKPGESNKALGELLSRRKINSGIAYEESGHLISMGMLTAADSSVLPVFTGNGIKAALNSYAADAGLSYKMKEVDRIKMLASPFEGSFKKTFYVYYSDRKKYSGDKKLRTELKSSVRQEIKKHLGGRISLKEEIKAEEPDLIYFSLMNSSGENCGTVYIRNSGTEEKTQITVKCDNSISKEISACGENISHRARIYLKSKTQPNALLQAKLVNMLYYGKSSEAELALSLNQEEMKYLARVINESVKKEGLLSSDENGIIEATEKGRRFIEESGFKTDTACVILAAGKGTRMKSPLPKVLHLFNGKPMLSYSVELAKRCGISPVIAVVGYKAQMVKKTIGDCGIRYVLQREQLGTGHAVMQSAPVLKKFTGDVLILYGDIPSLTDNTIKEFLTLHRVSGCELSILTVDLENPFGYGRIIRDRKGDFVEIIEEKDTDKTQKKIKEINSGIYCVKAKTLFRLLGSLDNNNSQNEYYLTDIAGLLKKGGNKVHVIKTKKYNEIIGINSVEELKKAEILSRE